MKTKCPRNNTLVAAVIERMGISNNSLQENQLIGRKRQYPPGRNGNEEVIRVGALGGLCVPQ